MDAVAVKDGHDRKSHASVLGMVDWIEWNVSHQLLVGPRKLYRAFQVPDTCGVPGIHRRRGKWGSHRNTIPRRVKGVTGYKIA